MLGSGSRKLGLLMAGQFSQNHVGFNWKSELKEDGQWKRNPHFGEMTHSIDRRDETRRFDHLCWLSPPALSCRQ